MTLKILGTGCKKCKSLEENARAAVEELKLDANVEKVEKVDEIVEYGVMVTPALVVDGELKSAGKVLSIDELKKMLV